MSQTTTVPAATDTTASMAMVDTQTGTDSFHESIAAQNVAPLWTVLDKMVPPRPNPTSSATLWSYSTLRPLLMKTGELISAEEAERRVLMLTNPKLAAPYTTDTIYAGLQLILPGETAPAHRHTAFALRFIIEGESGFTAVEGDKIIMSRGDVILTPSWHWHDHGNEGSGPMVWLDGLDLPVYKFLPVNFAENYTEASRYPSAVVPDNKSRFRFPWADVQSALDADKAKGESYSKYHYRTSDGTHLSNTISGQAERIEAGSMSPPSRETCSFVYHVYQGTGHSEIESGDGRKESISWESKDTFCVPAWSKVSHFADQQGSLDGSAYLFAINDRPMIEKLGLARMEE